MTPWVVLGVAVVFFIAAVVFLEIATRAERRGEKESRMPDEKKEPRRFYIQVGQGNYDLSSLPLSDLRELLEQADKESRDRGYIRRVAGERTDAAV